MIAFQRKGAEARRRKEIFARSISGSTITCPSGFPFSGLPAATLTLDLGADRPVMQLLQSTEKKLLSQSRRAAELAVWQRMKARDPCVGLQGPEVLKRRAIDPPLPGEDTRNPRRLEGLMHGLQEGASKRYRVRR